MSIRTVMNEKKSKRQTGRLQGMPFSGIEGIVIRYLLFLILLIAGLLIWWTQYLSQQTTQNEWIVESDAENTFVADDTCITSIGLCYDNVHRDVYSSYDEYLFSGTLRIEKNQEDVIWEKEVEDLHLSVMTVEPIDGLLKETINLEQDAEYQVYAIDTDGNVADGITWSFYGSECGYGLNAAILFVFLLVAGSLLYFQYYRIFKLPFGVLWVGGILATAMVSMFAMIPICVPDEELHFYSSFALSSELLRLLPGQQELAQMVPTGILRFGGLGDKQHFYHLWTDWHYGNCLRSQADDFYLIGTMPHYGYIVSAIGITVARLLRLPYQWILVSGRLLNVLFYSLITLLAICVSPRMKRVVLCITFVPGTLWLMNSLSYDVWNLAFIILAVCYCDFLIEKKQILIREILFLLILMLIFIPIKYVYFIFLLFMLMLSPQQLPAKKRRIFRHSMLTAIVVAVVVAFLARGKEIILFLGAGGFDGRTNNTIDTTYTLGWVLKHPIHMMLVYIKTIYTDGGRILSNMLFGDFFSEGIPIVLKVVIAIAFVLTILNSIVSRTRRCHIIAGITLISGVLIVMTSFVFLYSTKTGGIGTISGMQGRYFVPFILCLPYVLVRKRENDCIFPNREGRALLREKVWRYILVAGTLCSILTRFVANIVG